MPGSQRGRQRERDLKRQLEEKGYWVVKAGGSLGDADLVALKAGERGKMIEVKSTTDGPYKSFGPKDREDLYNAAQKAGLEPYLVWWPPRKEAKWFNWTMWPPTCFK